MSNESIDLLWDESIHGLKKLTQDEEESINQSKSVSIPDAFLHFAKLYVRYTIILSNLGTCYDAAIQPQKRLDIKSTLEHVVSRVINLRHLLVKWAPPNADVISKDAAQQPFPWEYVDFNQALKELHVPPSQLEIATPSFLIDDSLQRIRSRNAFVASRLLEKFGPEVIPLEEKKWVVEPLATVSTEKEHRERKAIHNPRHDAQNKVTNIIPDHAATIIQTSVRGHICKKKTERDRQWLKGFVGMSDSSNAVKFNQLKNNISDIREKRKQEQSYCQESYEADLHSLKEVVRQEEGFGMQTDLREERIKWITDHVVNKNTLPDSFEEFYAKDVTPPDNAGDPKQLVDGKIDSSKSSKDKKGSSVEAVERPAFSSPFTVEILDSLRENINIYEDRWRHRNVGHDRVKSQYHDAEMAKSLIIRDQVKSELTKGVDEKLLSNLTKIKAMQEAGEKKSKSKKEGKGQGKKGKGKKAGGGKKEKPLPGAKLPGIKDMKVEEMLDILIQNGLICQPANYNTNDFIGGFQSEYPKFPGTSSQVRLIVIVLLLPISIMFTDFSVSI